MKHFDRIIIGAGIYGLYGALVSLKKSYSTLIIDIEDGPFQREIGRASCRERVYAPV